MLRRGHERDVQQRMLESWRLARVMAQAQNEPYLWTLRQNPADVVVSLDPVLSGTPSRTFRFDNCRVEIAASSIPSQSGVWQVLIAPHGVSTSLKLRVLRESDEFNVVLPGVVDSGLSIASAEHR
jgi:hypothetical protein